MQLQMTTDYAMRIVACMMTSGAIDKSNLVKARDMAEKLGIDYQYSMKIINKLKKNGIIKSIQGCTGGYYLDKKAFDLTLFDVITVMEGEINLLHCLENNDCSRNKSITCPVQLEFKELQDSFTNKLKEIKLKDILKNGF